MPSNRELGIANREFVTNEDKSIVLDPEKLALVKDRHVVMALRMEAEFGLRREEAIKFTPSRDDRGDRIRLKGSTTKGGRPREVPVLKDSQRRLLDEARRLAGGGALIPPDRNYKQQLKVYENRTRKAGLYRMHGLRHILDAGLFWIRAASRRITGSSVHRFRNNQRLFRKANRSSSGRYRAGRMSEGEVLAIARSLSSRSACR